MLKSRVLNMVTIGLIMVLALMNIFISFSFWWYIAIALLYAIIIVYASFNMGFNFFLKSYTGNAETNSRMIAITFDDGPHPEYTPEVLKLLKAYKAKATFFCIGKNAEMHPKLLKLMFEDGHQIGNHTFSHCNTIDFSSANQWIEEIEKTDLIIETIIQKKPRCFRPPYGVTTPKLAKAINKTGHAVIGWNLRSFDTVIKNPKIIVNKIIKRLRPGAIILLHDKQDNCIPVLECLLQYCIRENYKLVCINELLDEV